MVIPTNCGLFDSLAAAAPEPEVVPPPVPEMPKPDPQVLEMYTRVGQMTRKLHDALHELGYDKSLERAASTIPDAKDRLAYIASLTENAAMRALNATDQAGPHQDSIEKAPPPCRWDGTSSTPASCRWMNSSCCHSTPVITWRRCLRIPRRPARN